MIVWGGDDCRGDFFIFNHAASELPSQPDDQRFSVGGLRSSQERPGSHLKDHPRRSG